jgi:hypothetical protein
MSKAIRINFRVLLSALLLCLVPSIAWADTGLPMIVFLWPLCLIALVPVILLEAMLIFEWTGRAIKPQKIIAKVAYANLFSTILGIPLAWGLVFIVQLCVQLVRVYTKIPVERMPETMQHLVLSVTMPAWLPYLGDAPFWIPNVALFVLLVPAYLVTWRMEYLMLRKILHDIPVESLRVLVRNVNRITYVMLGLVVVVISVFQLLI